MKNRILSVIVPVYNVEKYLEQCIQSILSQTYDSMEIILVDDGSTDSSGQICDNYSKNHDNIHTYHKPNGGLMSAWKYGVTHSQGEYIGFVDSDDWIDKDMYEKLMSCAVNCGADLVICGLVFEYESKGVSLRKRIVFEEGVYYKREILDRIFPILISGGDYKSRGISPNKVTKIFKRSVLENSLKYCDDAVSIGEDLLTTFCCMQKVECLAIMDDFFPYHYRINSYSMIQKYSDDKYNKLKLLHQALTNVNSTLKYNFSVQIDTDFLKLMLMQLENEILFSNKSTRELICSIKKFYDDKIIKEVIANSEYNKLPLKYRLYIYLLDMKLYIILLLIRKLKR